ncbi:MAG: metallophosphoesterase [Polyangiaceae bacterium]
MSRFEKLLFVGSGAAWMLSSCAGQAERATAAMEVPSAVAPAPVSEEAPRAPAPPTVRRLGKCDDANEAVSRFNLAHINDFQARYSDRIQGKSRYGYVAGYLRDLKARDPETLVLDAGDDYEKGSIAELRSMGESTRVMIQALPIDARTIGNHDFAYGEAAVLRDARLSSHPVLAANIQVASSPFVPFARIDVGCVRVGIIGLVTGNYGADDKPSKDAFDDVFVHDPHYARVLEEQVLAHRAEVDVMIALDHLGLWEDVALAGKVPGIDLVVGGHSEDTVKQPYWVSRKDGSHAWVMQAGHYAETLGRAELAFHRKEKSLSLTSYAIVKVDASLPYADDVGELASSLEAQHAPDAHRVLGVLRGDVPQGKGMADLLWRATSESWGVDALIVGKDLFWDKLHAGPVTLQGLYDTTLVQREPAGTSGFASLHVVRLTGAQLTATREKLRVGPVYEFYGPEVITPDRVYRVAIEKRALTYPKLAFYPGVREFPRSRFLGEMIDALEPYARARTARGLSLD